MVIAVAENPCFAERPTTGQRCAEKVSQTSAAPKPILIDWFESQGVQKLLTQESSLLLSHTVCRPYRPERCLCVIASSWNCQ